MKCPKASAYTPRSMNEYELFLNDESARKKKRMRIFIISFIFLGVFLAGGYYFWGYFQAGPPEPPPPTVIIDPGGNEPEAVDIESLIVPWATFFQAREGSVDIAAAIQNPNKEWGGEHIFYQWILFDVSGAQVKQGGGVSFILHNDEKFIVIPAVRVNTTISELAFTIERVDWRGLDNFLELSLDIRDVRHENVSDSSGFVEKLSGIVRNSSFFGLINIDVNAVLFDGAGNPIAANRSDMQTMLPGEERLVEMFWPNSIGSDPAEIVVSVDSNIFTNSSFLKQYGTPQKFQEYYNVNDASRRRR